MLGMHVPRIGRSVYSIRFVRRLCRSYRQVGVSRHPVSAVFRKSSKRSTMYVVCFRLYTFARRSSHAMFMPRYALSGTYSIWKVRRRVRTFFFLYPTTHDMMYHVPYCALSEGKRSECHAGSNVVIHTAVHFVVYTRSLAAVCTSGLHGLYSTSSSQ